MNKERLSKTARVLSVASLAGATLACELPIRINLILNAEPTATESSPATCPIPSQETTNPCVTVSPTPTPECVCASPTPTPTFTATATETKRPTLISTQRRKTNTPRPPTETPRQPTDTLEAPTSTPPIPTPAPTNEDIIPTATQS